MRDRLPDYMVPAAVVLLDALPVTANGKLDRKALPPPDRASAALAREYAPPRTPAEQELARIWADVLGLEQIGIYDNFFELGGHSLAAIQVMAHVRSSFPVDLPLRWLFEHPTIADLADLIAQSGATSAAASPAPRALPPSDQGIEQLLAEIEQLPDDLDALSETEILALLNLPEP